MASTADTAYKNTGGTQTKISSIPEAPADASAGTKKFLAAIKEVVEVREGKRGNSLDRSVIVRDLLDQSFITKYWPDGGTSNPNVTPSTGQRDTTAPAPVTDLSLDQEGGTSNVLTWTNPVDTDLGSIEIRAAHVDAIPVWASDMDCYLDDLFRYSDGYVYRFTETGPIKGASPSDPVYGVGGTDPYWVREAYPYRTVSHAYPKAVLSAQPGESLSWTHTLSGTDLAVDWYYWVRALDKTGNESNWTPAGTEEGLLAYAKTGGLVVPDPANLVICETGSTSEFNALDVNICWDPSTNPSYVKDYAIEVLDTSTGARRRFVEHVRSNRWTYAYGMNKSDTTGCATENADGANDNLTIRLWAVDLYGRQSDGYDEITITNPAPSALTTLTATGIMQGVRFEWEPVDIPDLSHYEYRLKVEAGSWSDWVETTDNRVDRFLTNAENVTYSGEATIYIEVKVVDTWGNVSSAASANAVSESFIVKPHNIDDFAVNASKIWLNLPVLQGDSWYANSPSAGYVRWTAHTLYLNGVAYSIPTGNTNKKYIYWVKPNAYYSTSDTNPDLVGSEGWVIAVNINGSYDLAWNAIANQIIGSAYIEDASILTAKIGNLQVTNAKIYGDLDANKIVSGYLQSQNWGTSAGSRFALNDGTFELGGSTSPKLSWDGSTLTLKGTIFQNAIGAEFPVPIYRGAYSGGTAYYKGDMVVYDRSSWICKVTGPVTGVAPSSVPPGSTSWDCYAEAGDDGVSGADGPGVAYRGEWMPSTSYIGTALIRDVVKYNGIFYRCISSHTSVGDSWVEDTKSDSTTIAASGNYTFYPTGYPSAVQCSRIMIYLSSAGTSSHIKLYAYYDGGWKTILHDSVIDKDTWVVVSLGATKNVTGLLVYNLDTSDSMVVSDTQFGDVDSAQTPPSLSAYWTAFGATFSSVASDIVLANDVTVLHALVLGAADSNKGVLRAGKTAFSDDTNKGLWLGYDTDGVAKFKVGDHDYSIDWDGTTFTINGSLVLEDNILSGAVTQCKSGSVTSDVSIAFFSWNLILQLDPIIVKSSYNGALINAVISLSAGYLGCEYAFWQVPLLYFDPPGSSDETRVYRVYAAYRTFGSAYLRSLVIYRVIGSTGTVLMQVPIESKGAYVAEVGQVWYWPTYALVGSTMSALVSKR